MTETRWLNGPVGLDAHSRVLRQGCRTVLVVVPYVVAGTRLVDVLALLEADHRVTVVFTVAPMPNETLCHGAEQFVRAQGGFVLPWHQAVQCEFDLILAASETSVAQLHGKVLLLPHGAGAMGSRLHARSAGPQACTFHGLDRGALIWRGRLVPAALPLTHDAELAVLRTSCPEALPVSTVAGDICFDRLVASLPWRESYRAALGLGEGQKLVTVTSTWQPESALGRHPDLLDRLAGELPTRKYRLAAILHPNIWAVHGAWQVRAWLANCLRAGLLLLPPEEGWRAALIASDVVIGDYGSVTSYAAAIGAPVLRASSLPEDNMRDDSLAAAVARLTPQLRLDWSLTGQLRAVIESHSTGLQAAVSDLITSRPGQAGTILRRMMYGLLELPEPARQVVVHPVPLPGPVPESSNLCPRDEL
ncbi:hypothetical protein ACFW9M_19085 [Streptomyces lydicus]|uniref:hypothetical protein n=1 Tax=Streptomyces lydicus TaxID=47763 RepID=UPI00367CE262